MDVGPPERALIDRCLQGDRQAFGELVEMYQARVYALAYHITGNREDASDMAQEAFIRIFRALPGFKGRSAFSTWVFRVVVNVCLDELRRRRFRAVPLEGLPSGEDDRPPRQWASSAPGPDEEVERRELAREIRASLGRLRPLHRLAVVLRDLQGLSYQEMAAVFGCSLGTVKSRLSRARDALKQEFLRRELLRPEAVSTGERGERA
ncbi:MAG: sigma-70 family RNA polymerase sigma factor [Acetobacteraceae bacterium]|nr:sigma-70 family RNA polymerase sigma factor [Acetobacteraceae bacterium]